MTGHEDDPHRSQLDVSLGEHLGVPVLHLSGELDSATVKHLYQAVDDVLLSHAHILLIDFAGLTYLDSAGLNVLFDTTRALSDRGWVGAVHANPVVRKLLDMGGLTHHPCFRVFEDMESVTL